MCLYCENVVLLEAPSAADDGCLHAPLRHFLAVLSIAISRLVGFAGLIDRLSDTIMISF